MSVAPMGRRLLALIVDWLLCALIASSLTGHVLFGGAGDKNYFAAQYATLGLFVLEVYLLTAISGLTVGKRMLRHPRDQHRRQRPRLQVGGRAHAAAAVRRPGLHNRP